MSGLWWRCMAVVALAATGVGSTARPDSVPCDPMAHVRGACRKGPATDTSKLDLSCCGLRGNTSCAAGFQQSEYLLDRHCQPSKESPDMVGTCCMPSDTAERERVVRLAACVACGIPFAAVTDEVPVPHRSTVPGLHALKLKQATSARGPATSLGGIQHDQPCAARPPGLRELRLARRAPGGSVVLSSTSGWKGRDRSGD
jgi:hypothetical protein